MLIDGFNIGSVSDDDIITIISDIDERIKKYTNVQLRGISLIDEKMQFGWLKPQHYLISYNWQGQSEYSNKWIYDGKGHVEIYAHDLKSRIRELKLNKIDESC